MMEFLNNIWVALNTPNDGLMNILSIPLAFIESSLTLYLLTAVFSPKLSTKKKLLYIITSAVVSIISLLFLKSPFNVIFNYVISFVIIYTIFRTNTIKTIIATILPSFVFTIVQSLIFNPYITLLNITYSQATSTAMYKFPFTLLMYLLIFIVTFIIKNKKITLNFLDEFDKKSKRILIPYLIFGLIYIIIEIIKKCFE